MICNVATNRVSQSNRNKSQSQHSNLKPTTQTQPPLCLSNTLKVTSTTLQQFIDNEGGAFFESVASKNDVILNMMDVDNVIHEYEHVLRCSLCHKYAPTTAAAKCKCNHGLNMSSQDLKSKKCLKSLKRSLEDHVNRTLIHGQYQQFANVETKPNAALYIKVETVFSWFRDLNFW